MSLDRLLLIAQLAVTLAVLAWLPGNPAKLLAFVVCWALTFRRISRVEAVFFASVCIFFTVMNAASLRQGIFAFTDPDVLGMPVYELLMWGFYLLHTKRLLDGPVPPGPQRATWVLALLYALAFATLSDATALLLVTGLLLAVALLIFHEPFDLAYVAYLVLLGAAVEYTGVWSGQWHYPGDPAGGVPPWFVTLWGGVGLFLRRLVLPIVARHEGRERAETAS